MFAKLTARTDRKAARLTDQVQTSGFAIQKFAKLCTLARANVAKAPWRRHVTRCYWLAKRPLLRPANNGLQSWQKVGKSGHQSGQSLQVQNPLSGVHLGSKNGVPRWPRACSNRTKVAKSWRFPRARGKEHTAGPWNRLFTLRENRKHAA